MSDDTIKLRSLGATALVINLEPPREVRDSLGQKYVESPGRVIKFNAGRARIPSEWLDDLKKTASWKRRKIVVDDGTDYGSLDGPIVVNGSLTAARHVEAPLPGWNDYHQARLAKAIRDGEVKDLDRAIAFEKGNKNRKMILKALYVKAAEDFGADPEPPAAEVISRPAPLPGGEA